MSNARLASMKMPSYTKGEEIFNMVSHIAGGALGITATVLCVVVAAVKGSVYGVIGGAIFGTTMIMLYCVSSIYHGLNPDMCAKRVFRILDHCAIYLLVAGTYTPITLCTVREYNTADGWTLFGIVWGLAALGITITAATTSKYKKIIEIILYLGMGWCVVFAKDAVFAGMETGGLIFLLVGGIAYTIGAALYALGKKKNYVHSVFHLFVVFGSLMHFFCILFYVL